MWTRKRLGMIGLIVCGWLGTGWVQAAFALEAREVQPPPTVFEEIQIKRQDVTGDGRQDLITLLGKKFAADRR